MAEKETSAFFQVADALSGGMQAGGGSSPEAAVRKWQRGTLPEPLE